MTELQVTEIINVINLTVIDQTTTTDYEITEVVETIHLTITEKFGSDGLPGPPGPASTVPGPKGDPGTSITKTSELTNDGEDGVNAFITAQDIPAPIEQVNSDWNATSGPSEILNKPTIPAPVDISTKAETDASNLTTGNVEQWRTKLNVPDNPDATITIGEVTADSSAAYLALHTSGANAVLIDGVVYSRTDAQTFPFTPVTTGQKILIVYALPDAQVFHLAQGAESTEAVEPAYSGLFVARLLVTDEGIDIVESVSGFREKSVDNFAIYSLAAGDRILGIGSQMRLKVQSSGAIRIGGFVNEEGKVYNGCPISVRNDTPFDMEFYNAVSASPEFMPINTADIPFKIKPGETANFAWRGNVAEIIKTGGGGAELPPGTNGQIYEIDNILPEKIKPSDRLTDAETNITDLFISQIEITTTTSITTNTLGSVTGKGQHMRSVLVKNGVNAINITLETTSHAKFEAIYYKKGSAAITFLAGAGATLVKVANDGILNGAVDSNALVYRDGDTFHLYISNY